MPEPTRSPEPASRRSPTPPHQQGSTRDRPASAPSETHAEKHDYSVKPFGRCGQLNPAASHPTELAPRKR